VTAIASDLAEANAGDRHNPSDAEGTDRKERNVDAAVTVETARHSRKLY
jgi:hypothetical protein